MRNPVFVVNIVLFLAVVSCNPIEQPTSVIGSTISPQAQSIEKVIPETMELSTPIIGGIGRMTAVGEYQSRQGVFVLNSDGTVLSQIAETMTREDSFPSLSPDETSVVFGGKDADIYLTDIENKILINLTYHPSFDRHPIWSPDGTKIAFESNRSGSFDLFIMDADGSNVLNILNTSDDESLGGWSPDGNRIIFTSLVILPGQEGVPLSPSYSIRLVDLISGGVTTVFDESQGGISKPDAPTFSPDGSKIAFQGIVNGQIAIYVIDIDGTDLRRITGDNYQSGYPVWSPDGETIVAFTSLAGMDDAKGVPTFFSLDGVVNTKLTDLHVLITSWVNVNEALR